MKKIGFLMISLVILCNACSNGKAKKNGDRFIGTWAFSYGDIKEYLTISKEEEDYYLVVSTYAVKGRKEEPGRSELGTFNPKTGFLKMHGPGECQLIKNGSSLLLGGKEYKKE